MINYALYTAWRSVQNQLRREGAVLLPLRLFIGLGWTRSAVEKLLEPAWYDGSVLLQFFAEQFAANAVHFPFYEKLVATVFVPQVQILSWVIIGGQLLAGMAIGLGFFTNLALLGGLFMNLNFVLIGRVNPSAFYIVIQVALFVGDAGMVLGLDALVGVPILRQTAVSLSQRRPLLSKQQGYLLLSCLSWLAALLMVPFIKDYGPHSVEDPAMLLFILLALGGLSAFIRYARCSLTPVRTGADQENLAARDSYWDVGGSLGM